LCDCGDTKVVARSGVPDSVFRTRGRYLIQINFAAEQS